MKPQELNEDSPIMPALGDDELWDMFLDEWERKLDMEEDEDEDSNFKPNQNIDHGKEDFRSY